MKFRATLLIAAIVACVSVAASASAADRITLTEARGQAFPDRAWVLSLPAGERLKASAVKVTENGRAVRGLAVNPAGSTSAVSSGTILAIDASDSMRGQPIKQALSAAEAFAARRNVNQRLGIVTFNSSTDVAVPLTLSQDAIEAALAKQPKLRLKTHIYDAIAEGIAQLRASDIGAGSIVVLSDGADIGSSVTLDQAVQSAKAAHVRIYTIGLRSKTFHPAPLQQLASATGGSYSPADSGTELAQIYDTLGLKLAQEYIVTYHSTLDPGTRIKVALAVDGIGATNISYVARTTPGPGTVFHHSALDDVWKSPLTMIVIALLVPMLVAAAIVVPLRQRGSTVKSRVSDYVSMPQHKQKRDLDALVSRVFTGTERSLEKTRWWQRFKDSVAFADMPVQPVHLIVGTFILTLFAGWLLWRISPVVALLALGVPLLLRSVINGRISRKRRIFSDQLADNLDVLASGLRAGHSLVGALSVMVADASEPSKSEFQRVIADEQLGVPLEAALDRVVVRMKNRDLEQVSLVASVQSETGGNAAEVLDRVTESIRERQDLRRLIRSLTAQGRLSRWVVSLLPVALLAFISAVNPAYMKPMFHHTSGIIALMVGAVMMICGSVAIGRIVDIEV